jgi:hypothetical protein
MFSAVLSYSLQRMAVSQHASGVVSYVIFLVGVYWTKLRYCIEWRNKWVSEWGREWVSEWVSEWGREGGSLTLNGQSFSCSKAKTSNSQWNYDDVHCTKPTSFIRSVYVLAHWNNSPRKDMSPHSDTFSWFWPSGLWSYSLNLRVGRRRSKYQYYCLWFWPFHRSNLRYQTPSITRSTN